LFLFLSVAVGSSLTRAGPRQRWLEGCERPLFVCLLLTPQTQRETGRERERERERERDTHTHTHTHTQTTHAVIHECTEPRFLSFSLSPAAQIVAARKKAADEAQQAQRRAAEDAEAERWRDVPEWKRGVLQRKEKEVCVCLCFA
jgi:hypothetical protein